jgi:myo-inositol catabolism protein IolC
MIKSNDSRDEVVAMDAADIRKQLHDMAEYQFTSTDKSMSLARLDFSTSPQRVYVVTICIGRDNRVHDEDRYGVNALVRRRGDRMWLHILNREVMFEKTEKLPRGVVELPASRLVKGR